MRAGPAAPLQALANDWDTDRHDARGWPLFLSSVKIEGLRGWAGELVEFRFPVVAIAGENGSGKSTVLKTAAAAYRNAGTGSGDTTFNPDDFFPSTQWEAVTGVTITYTVRLGATTREYRLRKPTHRWRGMPDREARALFFLDISRTQPIDTLIGYGKIAKDLTFAGHEAALTQENRDRLSRIMRRTYTDSRLIVQGKKAVGILHTGVVEYSNFHQGAGEDTTADLVALLQDAPDRSLVIIDEVESSLHPRAQRRLVLELMDLARRKRMQFILSTHSPFVLEQLPSQARVYIKDSAEGKKVIYGVSSQYALSMMDELDHPELTLYCEDAKALAMVEALLADGAPDLLRRVSIISVGPAHVVRALGGLAHRHVLPEPGLGVLDGDQDPAPGCVVLPGSRPPELEVIEGQTESSLDSAASRLGVRPGELAEAIDDARRLPEPHSWPKRIAEGLGPRHRSDRVWEALVAAWVSVQSPEDRESFVEAVTAALPATP